MRIGSITRLTAGLVAFTLVNLGGCVGQLDGDVEPPIPLDDAGDPISDADSAAPDVDAANDAALDGDVPLPPPPPPSGLDCDAIEGVLFCDDFESGSIQTANWTKDTKNGSTIEVSNAKALQGNYALKVTMSTSQGTRAYISLTNIFPVAGNHFFGRVHMYITPDITGVHNESFYASGSLNYNGTTGEASYRLSTDGTPNTFRSRYVHPYITHTLDIHGGLVKPKHSANLNQWMCIEFEYDGPNNRMKYWFDGVEETSMTVTGTEDPLWKAPTFTKFYLGYWHLQAGTPAETVYYDAFVLDTERVGCGE